MKKYLIAFFCLTVCILSATEAHEKPVVNDEAIALQGYKYPAVSIRHAELSNFIFNRLIPAIYKDSTSYGEIRLNVNFSRFSKTSPVSVDLKLTGNNGLRDMSFVNKAKEGKAYVSKGDITILIYDVDSIAIQEGFIVRAEKDSLEVCKKYWSKIGIDDSEFFCYYFGLEIDQDSIYLDTFKNYGVGFVTDLLNESVINSILPNKSKSALDRERKKKWNMLILPVIID